MNSYHERSITLENGTKVWFDEISTIQFYQDETVIHIDPADLSAIYGAYQQMMREVRDERDT